MPAERETLSRHVPKETTDSIARWAEETFGPVGSDARIAARANEEMAELLRKVTAGETGHAVIDECADVAIILSRLVHRHGGDLLQAIDRKMAVNRGRRWRKDGTGHGYHLRDRSDEGETS